ncbi:hypothetical protein QFC22_005689 [Naganishia vaughanmartiniae]|uniref:Uncharacterized protein n=1 Tax=Naganishia vaughanmartiniae TaxID=1424756 RepID=A0ACC2WT69_9TREE|nr:hypothetical protein QFC22_005689 [Naganishia vaughanmartiniae]
MSEKTGAYGNKASEGSFRRKFDVEAASAKAKEQDKAAYEHAKSAEQAAAKGKKAPRQKSDLPKPTQALQARTQDLEIEKNLGKTIVVNQSAGGKGPGFYCELCRRTLKDSIAYLDHVNGRSHLARLGQTTQVRRSTLEQVRAHIAYLRSSTSEKVTSKNFDFEARLNAVKEQEEKIRQEKKESKKRKRDEAKANALRGIIAADPPTSTEPKSKKSKGPSSTQLDPIAKGVEEADQMASMMGFGGFGGQRKR